MKTVCKIDMCAGCHACVSVCAKGAIQIEDGLRAYNAVIDGTKCVECGRCEKVCPVNSPLCKSEPIEWAQGWAKNEDIRKRSSSGGIAAAIQHAFIRNGGAVCSCVFDRGEFVFDIALTEDEIQRFTGSKYVKSNPKNIYARVKSLLKEGTKVLFVGLPCQCAAMKRYTSGHELLYTADLICHGTPSPENLHMYLSEKGHKAEDMRNISFRKKANFHLSDEQESIEPRTVRDCYTMAFLRSLCYTENCYYCDYATTARVSDITLGDSWGSTLDQGEQEKGVSLILCQTDKGKWLLGISDIHLEDVDIPNAIKNNKQLSHPSAKPRERELFYATLNKTGRFGKAVRKCYPKDCFRQSVKATLVRLHLR